MFSKKKHNPYRLTYSGSPEQLDQTMENTMQAYVKARSLILEIRADWAEYKTEMTEQETVKINQDASRWFSGLINKVRRVAFEQTEAMDVFEKYADMLYDKYGSIAHIHDIVKRNLEAKI